MHLNGLLALILLLMEDNQLDNYEMYNKQH